MASTHNGWSITFTTTSITAEGHSTKVRPGDVTTVLGHVAEQFHQRIEPIKTFHGWRSVATNSSVGGIASSNHLSGTAIDINGGKYAMGKPGTFTANQAATIREILAETSVVAWGGDFPRLYGRRIDVMHFEIAKGKTQSQVGQAASRLGHRSSVETVRATQVAVRAANDGIWGSTAQAAWSRVHQNWNGR